MAKKKKINWDRQPLGKKSDREIAKKLGVTPLIVKRHREERGIPVADRYANFKSKNTNWDEQPLGQLHDSVIAERVGVSVEAVGRARRRRNIPALGKSGTPKETRESPRKANGRVDWDRETRLGKMPDGTLAEILGLSKAAVQKQRKKRGLPLVKVKRKGFQRIGVDWDKEPLGKMPDQDLATLLDCAPQSVRYARESRGIAPYHARKRVSWSNS